MANIPLKDIVFPGLDDTYTVPQIDTTLAVTGAAADAKKVGDELGNLKEDYNSLNERIGYDEYLINNGTYTIQASDLESGQWGYSTKVANAARARTKYLIPVRAGMILSYENTTYDTYFGVLETPTSSSYSWGSGWETNKKGIIIIPVNGWMTFIIRNSANTSAIVNPADYDSIVSLTTQLSGRMTDADSLSYSDTLVTDAVLCDSAIDGIQWTNYRYIDSSTGDIKATTTAASVSDLIRIPNKATAIITSYSQAVRYSTYDADGTLIDVFPDNFGIEFTISSEDARYFRLQYNSVNATALQTVNVTFKYTDAIAHISDLTGETGFSNEYGSATGNPITIGDSSADKFVDMDLSDADTGEIISVCGKNIFNFQHKAKLGMVANDVTFKYNMQTNVMSIESANGATATTISSNNSFTGCTQLDGVTAYHNFHFRFPVDTPVTITPNYSYDPYYDDKILLQLLWVDNNVLEILPVGYEGVTIVAKAGVQYGLRVRVSTGFTGAVTLSPQVEIGTNGTVFESYHGADIVLPVSDGTANAFELEEETRLSYGFPTTSVMAKYGYATKTVQVISDNASADTVVYHPDYDGTVNGQTWFYLFKFTPGATPVCINGVPKNLAGLICAQISDGTNTNTLFDDKPILIIAEANREYAYRLRVVKNSVFDYTFTPVIATGKEAIKLFGSSYPVTNIYTDGDADLSVKYRKATNAEQEQTANDVAKNVNVLTAGKIVQPFKRLKNAGPIVTFIDDDTTNATLVQRFHDIFDAEGVVGNYAVEMKNVDDNTGLAELLLEYEQEGFGMLYHCYKQAGDADRYWESGNEMYDETLIRANFYQGLREYKQVGFNSARYWVTPYGVNDEFIRRLAKEADMECLLSCPTGTYACNAVLEFGSNYYRYNLPRTIFLSDTDNDFQSKALIDGCADAKGWLIIVTHVNSWASADIATNTARLTALIQYAKNKGCRIANFMDAYQTFKPLLMLNELF